MRVKGFITQRAFAPLLIMLGKDAIMATPKSWSWRNHTFHPTDIPAKGLYSIATKDEGGVPYPLVLQVGQELVHVVYPAYQDEREVCLAAYMVSTLLWLLQKGKSSQHAVYLEKTLGIVHLSKKDAERFLLDRNSRKIRTVTLGGLLAIFSDFSATITPNVNNGANGQLILH